LKPCSSSWQEKFVFRFPPEFSRFDLSLDAEGQAFCLHGLTAVFLTRHGWYRVDPRGDKPGITTDFCPPAERLAFAPRLPGEADIPGRYSDALPCVVSALRRWRTADEVARNLPDCAPR